MYVRVALPGPFLKGLDYKFPFSDAPVLYTRVLVPLGKRQIIGIIIDKQSTCDFDHKKLKSVLKVLDTAPVISSININMINWLSHYYHSSLYQAFKLALPKLLLQREHAHPSCQYYYVLAKQFTPAKNAHQQQKALSLLSQESRLYHEDLKQHNIHLATIQALLKKEVIIKKKATLENEIKPAQNINNQDEPTLNKEQQHAVQQIQSRLYGFSTTLIFGITGSGKTEVYLQAIKPLIKQNKQVLVLVPEINLTPQTQTRFYARFAVPTVVINSKISDQTRLNYYYGIQQNHIKIVISTRAGLLCDFKELGMIIVDEEHDSSFKQQNGIHYHARDMAIVKAKAHDIPVILGSGTPSIESYYHAKTGKYHLLNLTKRALNQTPNTIQIINLQKHKAPSGISSILKQKISQSLENNDQVLLFVNRRGFAHSLICQDCGWCAQCDACETPYTLHLHPQHLSCHFCGKGVNIFTHCKNCQSTDLIDFGSGTEKLEHHLSELFPLARIARLDRTATQRKGALEKQLHAITQKKVDIIVGTQMIAKGHDFQHVNLVGIINADAGFYSQDFHAIEKNAQLITQVAGRTGRGIKAGEVLLQTYQPDNPMFALLLNGHYQHFLEHLLTTRKMLLYPPFSYQAYIYAQASQQSACITTLNTLAAQLGKMTQHQQAICQISGPIPAIAAKRSGKYRFSLMLTANNRKALHYLLKSINRFITQQTKVKLTFDIDPIEIK
ncbi:primosomal protein N' [Facilibium subflavum]|uniref:primosomal protein N' n=1 Tax=Facilibium subflavum TaxID=2219058 RepID=UPI000E653B84|nr:primosomal protein N' [Facilibium subflavum]